MGEEGGADTEGEYDEEKRRMEEDIGWGMDGERVVDITVVPLDVADAGVEKVGVGGRDIGDSSPLGEAGGKVIELEVGGYTWPRDDETELDTAGAAPPPAFNGRVRKYVPAATPPAMAARSTRRANRSPQQTSRFLVQRHSFLGRPELSIEKDSSSSESSSESASLNAWRG